MRQRVRHQLRHEFERRPAASRMPTNNGRLEVSFDTGGMVSTALNYGASSPIDIQVEGGRQAKPMRWLRKSAIESPRSAAPPMRMSCSGSTRRI